MSLKKYFLIIKNDKEKRKIAIEQRKAQNDKKQPGLFWLGGFKSDMQGTKALALDEFGKKLGLEVTRFDYSGHGESSGEFINATISDWLEEASAVFAKTTGKQIIIGSSMGGWIAILLNKFLNEKDKNRIKAIILIAPAIDMTKDLMQDIFSKEQKEELQKKGFIELPSDYDEPYIISKKLLDDGQKYLLFGKGSIKLNCPLYILQGGKDKAVPPSHSLKLMAHLTQDSVNYSFIPDGDHSLSRKEDLGKLFDIITQYL